MTKPKCGSVVDRRTDTVRAMRLFFAIAIAIPLMAAAVPTSAFAEQCTDRCRSAHNQCRIATKGTSSVCDSRMQACMDSCRTRR